MANIQSQPLWLCKPGSGVNAASWTYTLRWPRLRFHFWNLNCVHLCFFISSFTVPQMFSLFQPNCSLYHALLTSPPCAIAFFFFIIQPGFLLSYSPDPIFLKSFPDSLIFPWKIPFLTSHTDLSLSFTFLQNFHKPSELWNGYFRVLVHNPKVMNFTSTWVWSLCSTDRLYC